jgi:hypothetical protein
MLPVKPLAIGVMTVAAVFPAASAFAQVKVNIGIGINTDPYPQPAVYYPQPRTTERVIVVERNTQTTYYDNRAYRWENRGRGEGRKNGWRKYKKHRDYDD